MNQQDLINRYQSIRNETIEICRPLAIEDYVVQPRTEVSPPKWHMGHTSWVFEAVVLKQYKPDYQYYNQDFLTLFNSYYKAAGKHTIQSERGTLSRPTVAEILKYREHIDQQMLALLETDLSDEVLALIDTSLHHEQQHQELLYMDIKAILASNALVIQYTNQTLPAAPAPSQEWTSFEEGIYASGYAGDDFSYDNERPRHKNYLYPFAIRQSLVTNGEYLAFIEDNAYCQAGLWLSQGWDWVNNHQIQHPLYWFKQDGKWFEYTLHGILPLDLNRPLVHISYFEANAFANWKGMRLPTEHELETFLADTAIIEGEQAYHPNNANADAGQVWCWTSSQYLPYPGFKTFDGLLKEYNGKFMCNQFVLKGNCVATPKHHYRHTYRNFYLAEQRWMFSGIRLAKDIV